MYTQGVKLNVLHIQRGASDNQTEQLPLRSQH